MKLSRFSSLVSEEDLEDEFHDVERSDPPQDSVANDILISDSASNANDSYASFVASRGCKQEPECLVRGGLSMALRKKGVAVCKYPLEIVGIIILRSEKVHTEESLVSLHHAPAAAEM